MYSWVRGAYGHDRYYVIVILHMMLIPVCRAFRDARPLGLSGLGDCFTDMSTAVLTAIFDKVKQTARREEQAIHLWEDGEHSESSL